MAVALVLATAPVVHAAAAKSDPLIGATRDKVLEKFGEPKNTMVAGNREVLFFEHDRVTLRDNVVISVERIFTEPRRPVTPPPAPAPVVGDQPASSTATPPVSGSKEGSAPASVPTAPAAAPTSTEATAATAAPATPVAPAAPDPNAPLEIRVRAPGSRPVQRMEPAVTATTPTPSSTVSAPAPGSGNAVVAEKSVSPAPATPSPVVAVPSPSTGSIAPATPVATEAPAASGPKPTTETPVTIAPAEAAKSETPEAEEKKDSIQKKAKAGLRRARRAAADALEDDLTEEQHRYLPWQTYLIGAVTVGAGLAFLLWRSRQRQLELAATAVSRTPFSTPVAASSGGGAIFNLELVGKLEWKRFEELVASYYSKTGVVAARTKTGPASPVHIKISWKGEPRPFALVQCISHPSGLIDAKPLQELVNVLAAEDIRRGYVVTTGKFNVPARDFAEEKHITLLPGDIFLEKINALPDAARNELMSEVTNGDYTTPSCPKCEAKMVRNPDDASQWRCAAHPDQVIPAK